jgi:GNAT superfamily N-acetyltransferase
MIERLSGPLSDKDVRGLARLLMDAIDSGAAASFLASLTQEAAEAWWRTTLASARPGAVFLAARQPDGAIVGTVQMHPVWEPNQPHRADILKLLVHRRARRQGLGARLMQRIEDEARRAGFRLLTLDTKRGDPAERLYLRLGWTVAGTIPGFAVDPDGVTPHDAVFFYKELARDLR